jgi:hypothetical protein
MRANSFAARVAVGTAVLGLVLLRTYPLTYLEYDELLFGAGVASFEPLRHHPHPPGFPVYIAMGKAVDAAVGDPFRALVLVSAALSLVGFVALAAAFRRLLREEGAALTGALLFYLSAGMVVHETLALSDVPAIGLLAAAIYFSSRSRPLRSADSIGLGVLGSLAVGCRPQLAVMVVPFLALVIWQDRRRARTGTIVAAAFGAASLAWLLPLAAATGGLAGLVRYETRQASDVLATDARLARSGWSGLMLAQRFVAHPWGPKILSLPILAGAAIGLAASIRRREWPLLPLVASGGLYLAFALAVMDPADGVRYALPAALVVAALAGLAFASVAERLPGWIGAAAPAVLTAVLAAGSLVYVAPIVTERHATASPPKQAAAYASSHLPPGAVVVYEPSLQPHVQQLFAGLRTQPIEPGFGRLTDETRTPVFVLADGGSTTRGAVTFSWRDSDAYGKVTRNHYRVVSLEPVPPASRFRAVSGVYLPSRTVAGQSYRWLAPLAEVALPEARAASARLRLGLPADYPWPSLGVEVCTMPCATRVSVTVGRGASTDVVLGLANGAASVRIRSARAFVPADHAELRQYDRRSLGVMLISLSLRGRDAAGLP